MTEAYFFARGNSPLLISIPHDGRELAPDMEQRMTKIGRSLPDTDWHVRRLYEFASELDASVIAARFSRYVIDVNRPSSDEALYEGQVSTGLCPVETFSGEHIYTAKNAFDKREIEQRIHRYWKPYHDKLMVELTRIHEQFGYALLWDAHSIPSQVPTLFEGVLPELNLGTNDGASCDPHLQGALLKVAKASGYATVLNGRFKGGYITRNYGNPANRIHAIQLELAQRSYMDETSLRYDDASANRLVETIQAILMEFVNAGRRVHRTSHDSESSCSSL